MKINQWKKFSIASSLAGATMAFVMVSSYNPVKVAARTETSTISNSTNPVVVNTNLTEEEVLNAQKAWGNGLVAIATTYDEKGRAAATALAQKVIDEAYGYDLGVVLFKPTLTEGKQTFRTTEEGALSYFVGGNPKFPSDSGFALKGWRKVEIQNAGILITGNMATTQGNVLVTDKNGKVTTVDKTWQFLKDNTGKIRIMVHHSSLPYSSK